MRSRKLKRSLTAAATVEAMADTTTVTAEGTVTVGARSREAMVDTGQTTTGITTATALAITPVTRYLH